MTVKNLTNLCVEFKMTIVDLINYLSTLPPEAEVVVSTYSCGGTSSLPLTGIDLMFNLDEDVLTIVAETN